LFAPKRLAPPRYEILKLLGRGAFGHVYLAVDTELGRRTVALKVLHYNNEIEEARIKREADLHAQLAHPNVIHVYDRGRADEGVYYIALELIKGVRLDKWLADEARSLQEILEVFLQIARGLQAVHECGLVHRDFKPSNVMVGDDGRARVLDFGLAKRVTRDGRDEGDGLVSDPQVRAIIDEPTPATMGESITSRPSAARRSCSAPLTAREQLGQSAGRDRCGETNFDTSLSARGRFVGTVLYSAPEQLSGGEVDARSDIFSFSVALFEATYGFLPFPGGQREQIMAQIAIGALADDKPVRRIPRWLARMLRRGLSSSPRDRNSNLGEIIRVLEAKLKPKGPVLRTIAGTTVAIATIAVAVLVLRPDPVMLDQEWQSTPEERSDLAEIYGPALAEQLDLYEEQWLSAGRTIDVDRGEAAVIDCLRAGRREFEGFTESLRSGGSTTEGPPPPHASMAPSRLLLADLLGPERCLAADPDDPDPHHREVVALLLESQARQLGGQYELALELAEHAREAHPELLSRVSGAIDFQRGYLELQLDRRSAWETLGRAAEANANDLEFFVEVLSTRLLAGSHLGVPIAEREEVSVRLWTVLEQLEGPRPITRAWAEFAEGQHRTRKTRKTNCRSPGPSRNFGTLLALETMVTRTMVTTMMVIATSEIVEGSVINPTLSRTY